MPLTDSGAGSAMPFAVTAAPRFDLDGRNSGRTSFTVTNLAGRPVRARIRPRGGQGAEDSWFTVLGAAEIGMAVGATATVDVAIAVPPGSPAGDRTMLIEVVAEDDTEAVSGQAVAFTVAASTTRPSSRWPLILIVALLVLAVAGVAVFLVLRKPSAPEAPGSIGNNRPPRITGDSVVGSALAVADQGSWSEADLAYGQRWQRCSGSACTDIEGATGESYTTTSDDLGRTVRVVVSVTRSGATGSAASNPIGPVAEPADACIDGFTWRLARDTDHVCVTPATRARVEADNAVRESRWVSGPYGPHTCLNGFVWREAFSGDDVCTTGDQRTQARLDNDAAPSRVKTQ